LPKEIAALIERFDRNREGYTSDQCNEVRLRKKEEIPPAFQLRRYAWSAKLPLSILTDFEEFTIYDTASSLKRPQSLDRPHPVLHV
jgi:hypothetical protein